VRLLLVTAHPCPDSFGAGLARAAREALATAGHQVRLRDLYAEGFDPVIREQEWRDYFGDVAASEARLADHLADLRWAEGLVLVYPTWWYGPPAMLKGWFERVWLPGVTFEVPKAKFGRITRKLDNIRLFVAVTTSGSPWWWLRLIRDPGRNLFVRGMRPLLNPRCRFVWRQLHAMNHATTADRDRFRARVADTLRRVPA
jgi:putative NADPH-quinone reductase